MKAGEHYNAALYLRLSRDDEDRIGNKAESNSIRSQRDMLCSYISKQENMDIHDIYVDDGFTGANFNRPEFQRMMEDIKVRKVNCVVVKDLSRLGRDYIEAGRLIQKTFPAFSVRFIALTDHYDSLTADYNETSLIVPIKNFINDSYSRDISGKVRSHLKVRREKGDFIGAFTVYGYKKSAKNRNLLVPDDYAADIVRKIFSWKIEGYSNSAIAERLDGMGILSPMEYKKMQGEKFQTGFVTGIKTKWSAVAVKRILTNENYTGTLVQGKEEKVNYKIKKSVKKPKEEWIRVYRAHEAILSREDFQLVQELLQIDIRTGKGEKQAHMYAGLLFCGDCMNPMIRRVNRYKGKESIYFICAAKNRGEECSRHYVSQEDLNCLVLAGFKQKNPFGSEMEKLCKEQEKYAFLREELYKDLEKQIITEEEYKNFHEIYEYRCQKLEQTIKKRFQENAAAERNQERMKTVGQVTELNRKTLVTFVKRIFVYEDKHVYLEFRCREVE